MQFYLERKISNEFDLQEKNNDSYNFIYKNILIQFVIKKIIFNKKNGFYNFIYKRCFNPFSSLQKVIFI